MVKTFEAFLEDKSAAEMFITGQAGTGKTTGLRLIVDYCNDKGVTPTVCAYTHQACNILRSKLPESTKVVTLWSYLKKRPAINEHATNIKQLQIGIKQGESEQVPVLLIDEYSFLGDKDYADLGLLQYDDEGKLLVKIVYIGDQNQLPPVNDTQAVYPHGKYVVHLTKVYRQAGDNPLLDVLTKLVTYIEGAEPEPLLENSHFKRNRDLYKEYLKAVTSSKVLLAYTNQAVQAWNAQIAGKSDADSGDDVFSPTIKQHFRFSTWTPPETVWGIVDLFGRDDYLTLGSQYKTLEHLLTMPGVRFCQLEDLEGHTDTFAVVFGHYEYKLMIEDLGRKATAINAQIERTSGGMSAKDWAMNNRGDKLARERAKAWRDYFAFKNFVMCIDFNYAMTVHKSQGSTYNTVLVDTQDLSTCVRQDYGMYLRLLYVAISRSSNMVFTN